jgi:drug/metabolite transporter (DMT)-like permease
MMGLFSQATRPVQGFERDQHTPPYHVPRSRVKKYVPLTIVSFSFQTPRFALHSAMVWFPLSIGAAMLWAVGAVLVKKGFETIPPLWNNIVNNFLALFVWIPAVLFLGGFRINTPPLRIVVVILSACFLYQFFYYSISRGQISLTSTIVAGYPVFTIALSHIFLHERLEPGQYLGVALILAGGATVALPRRAGGGVAQPPGSVAGSRGRVVPKAHEYSWVLWGLGGAFTLGTGDFLTKVSVESIGSYSHIFFEALILNLFSGFNYLVDRGNRALPPLGSRRFLPTLFGILMHLLGALLFLLAFGYGPASLVGPVSSVYPAFLALLAVRFLGDVITWKQGLGIGLIVGGLILTGWGGG